MQHPTDGTDQPDAVPPTELNPLVNPLLAQHMGRWAEVYFNSPPEKREQAVQNLLRELQGQHPLPENQGTLPTTLVRSRLPDLESSPAFTVEKNVICPACGHVNPPEQRFCGMCGAGLTETLLDEQRALSPTENGRPPAYLPESSAETGAVMEPPAESSHYFLDQRHHEAYPDDGHMMFESVEPRFSYGHRVLIGLVLAIAIGVLAYMAWRGGQSGVETSQSASQAPPIADQAAAPAPPADKPEIPKGNAPDPATTARNEAAPAPASAATTATPDPVTAKAPARPVPEPVAAKAASKPARVARAENAPASQPNPASGTEELVIAQRYLNAGSGQKRDPSQAAEWLWKAVAKQNPQATLLLADLYLRGDGIQKNCDQARVLLDAAARKGQTGAGQRLRNMQAFGCQ